VARRPAVRSRGLLRRAVLVLAVVRESAGRGGGEESLYDIRTGYVGEVRSIFAMGARNVDWACQ